MPWGDRFFLLPSYFLLGILLASSTASAATSKPENTAASPATIHCSVTRLDFITACETDEAAAEITNYSPALPNDLDVVANPSVDRAILPSRLLGGPLHFAETAPSSLLHPSSLPAMLQRDAGGLLPSSFLLSAASRGPPPA